MTLWVLPSNTYSRNWAQDLRSEFKAVLPMSASGHPVLDGEQRPHMTSPSQEKTQSMPISWRVEEGKENLTQQTQFPFTAIRISIKKINECFFQTWDAEIWKAASLTLSHLLLYLHFQQICHNLWGTKITPGNNGEKSLNYTATQSAQCPSKLWLK